MVLVKQVGFFQLLAYDIGEVADFIFISPEQRPSTFEKLLLEVVINLAPRLEAPQFKQMSFIFYLDFSSAIFFWKGFKT